MNVKRHQRAHGRGLRALTSSLALTGLLNLLPACGGGPSSATPVGGPLTSLRGQVVGTVSGQPVYRARVELGGAVVLTDTAGRFTASLSSGGILPIEVSASDHVTRRSFIRVEGAEPVIALIEHASLWNLEFYRELCRDGAGGGRLKALNPWTVEPLFYVDRSEEGGTGRPIPDSAVETVVEAIRSVVPLLSRRRLNGDRIEIGREPPADLTEGTVVIRWDPVEVAEVAGPASGFTRGVGGDASVVVLRGIEDTEAVFHELGHVLGLYHPLSGVRPSLMLGIGVPQRPHFTAWDIVHANILYSRPPGNVDVDEDPAGFVINGSP